jgi:hypothetical protein
MKTKFLVTALALMVIANASVMAQDSSPSFDIINQEGSSVYKLVYKSPGQGKVNLKIADKSGIIYTELLSFTDKFSYPLDFSGMNKGEYTITLSDKKKSLKKSIVYDVKIPLAFVHVAKQPNEKYMLTIKSEAPSDFTVRIYDRWNNEVMQKSESVVVDFGLVYNLSNLNGPFSFEVTNATGNVEVVKW